MYKPGKFQILALAMFVMLVTGVNLEAKTTPDCEIGDAVFRNKACGKIS